MSAHAVTRSDYVTAARAVAVDQAVQERPTLRYHAIEGVAGLELHHAVNADLQRIQSHRNTPIGSHTPATPALGVVQSVTTVPAGTADRMTVAIVYMADRDLFPH